MPDPKTRFTPEVRAEAVRLAQTSGRSRRELPPISGWGGPRCGTGSTAAIGRGSRRLLTVRRTGRPSGSGFGVRTRGCAQNGRS